VRETLEEAGVIGEVQEKIGVFVDGKKNRTHYYALVVSTPILIKNTSKLLDAKKNSLQTKEIVNDYEECGFRQRAWFTLLEAEKELLWRPVQYQVQVTWMSRHNFISACTCATAGSGDKDIAEVKQRHEKAIDEEELHKIAVEVKTSAG